MGRADTGTRRIWAVGGTPRLGRTFEPACVAMPSPDQIGAVYQVGDWLGGGEPTTRADFLDILGACEGPISLRTDGLALMGAGVLDTLKSRGVTRLGFTVVSIRPDAHDWAVSFPGAARLTLRAIRLAVDAGMEVHVDLVPTRSTSGLMMEAVGVLGRLGIHTLWIRRPRLDWLQPDEVLALSPRITPLKPELRDALAAAKRLDLRARTVGFSTASEDQWLSVDGSEVRPSTADWPDDYIQRFGGAEFYAPPTTTPDVARIVFGAPTPHWDKAFSDDIAIEPSRLIRQRMVLASQLGAPKLWVCNSGLLDHPEAPDLLWELTRLSFSHVAVAGEMSGLDECSERVFRRLRGIHRMEALVIGEDAASHDRAVGKPGAYDAIDGVLQRLREYAGVETGVYRLSAPVVGEGEGFVSKIERLLV